MNEEEASRKWYSVRKDDFKLTCDCIDEVLKQHGRIPFIIYAIYRLVLALYFFTFLIFFGVSSAEFLGVKFLIYLTDWTYILATLYLIVACFNTIATTSCYCIGGCIGKGVVRNQFQWLLLNISATVSMIVTVVYWTALRPFMNEKLPIYLDITIHLLPAIICLVDILLTTVIVRFVHVVYPFVYLFIYLLFAVIYWAAGGTDPAGNPFIYPIIDFGNYPGIAVASVFGVCLATLLAQAALKGLYALRHRYIDELRLTGTISHHSHEVLEVQLEDQS
ncbi:protein rolling stone-like [Lytechinus pictus]|uniref:protein rolling stone-like n=1 Tax=Lytechinus pictus TaxID=7653 RepID=UPI0030BA291C